jgi:hypothetical protein
MTDQVTAVEPVLTYDALNHRIRLTTVIRIRVWPVTRAILSLKVLVVDIRLVLSILSGQQLTLSSREFFRIPAVTSEVPLCVQFVKFVILVTFERAGETDARFTDTG